MNEIEWSYSKRSTLKTCAKAYYFSYFGANKLTAKGELDKERLHFLKQLQNVHERAGDLLHLTIATYFRHAHQGNTWIFDTERLINWTRKMFQNDRKYSRAYPDGDEKAKKNFGRSPALLQEFHYRDADADQLWQETEDRLVKAVHSFAANDNFEEFRIAGCRPNALIEHPINMAVYNVKIVGRIDLAFQVGDRITVVDWKIGSDTLSGSSSLQLAVYALWAVTHFNQPWDQIDVNMIQLESGRIITNEINEDELSAVRLRILQDAELMTTLQNYGKKALSEAFTPLLHPPICSLCQFKRVCYA